jgi:hypothetical protein
MRLSLAILGVAVLLLAGCGGKVTPAPSPTSVPHPTTFTSQAYGFSLTYDAGQLTQSPSGLSEPKHGQLVIDFIKQDLAGIEITALRETRAIGPGVVRRVLEHTLRGMYLPADQRRAVRPASVGGLPGLEVDGSAQGARTEVFAVGRGYYVYTIMIGADAKAWDKLRPMLEAAAQTFTILK